MIAHSTLWRDAVLLLAAAPLVYYALATIAALRFFRQARARVSNYTPSVSVLKPVRGVDFGSYENFASFCRQEYPDYEILFAVNDDADPALPVIQKISADFPGRRIHLLVGAEHLGANRKVNKLARLAREAQNEVLVLTDGDVRVGPRFLLEVVAPLADAKTKEWLKKMGGFEAIADTLADDYELGNRIAKAGGQIVLSPEPVWTMYPAQTFRSFWDHQVRWARTVRLCRPLSYVGLLFTQGLPWSLLAALVAPVKWIAGVYLLAYLILRIAMAWMVGIWGVGDEILRRKIWLVPLRDAIHFVIWLASFGSNRIRWGNVEYLIRQGRMVPIAGGQRSSAKPAEDAPRS